MSAYLEFSDLWKKIFHSGPTRTGLIAGAITFAILLAPVLIPVAIVGFSAYGISLYRASRKQKVAAPSEAVEKVIPVGVTEAARRKVVEWEADVAPRFFSEAQGKDDPSSFVAAKAATTLRRGKALL